LTTASRPRRAAILRAAEREFASAGYAGGRIERIAAAARVNKQLLFHYFESKEGLFAAALASLLAQAEPDRGPADAPVDQLRALLESLQRRAGSQPGLVAIVADAEANDAFPPAARALVRAWRRGILRGLEDALAEGQRRGHFRDDLDPAAVAKLGFAMALGAGTVEATEPPDAGRFLADACAWR
jgi:TetR/AcrR family transcriptional regulator